MVFFASIAVPMLKMVGLSAMLVSVQTGHTRWLRDRTRLYYIIRWIGRWSMIDIFMEALLGALVQFGGVVTIEPGYRPRSHFALSSSLRFLRRDF